MTAIELSSPTLGSENGVLAELGPGEYFGELGPMLGFPRSATARASAPTALRASNVRDFREVVLAGTDGTAPERA